jgi:DHA2 family methylenomycin A resistance protein-like MFS transporter
MALAVALVKRKRWTLGVMCMAVLMVQLDTTVVNLALRPIQRDLHTDVATLQWVVDAYNVVYGTLILTGAILGDRFGRKRLFIIGALVFGLGSAVSAIAGSALPLVLSRVITGVGAAIALPVSLAIVTATFTEKERNWAIGLWSGTNGIAIALGPSVGGLLVDHFGWRAIFVMFIPVTALVLGGALVTVAESRSETAMSLDGWGQAFAIATLGLFTFAIIEGPAMHWNVWIVLCLVGAVASLVAFVLVERRVTQPLIALDIFKARSFTGAILVTLAMTFGMYAFLFIVPNYLQTVTHLSAFVTGLLLLPNGMFFALLASVNGKLMDAIGARRMIMIGIGLEAVGLLMTLALGQHGPLWLVVVTTSVLGLALGFETGPLMAVAMRAAPKDRFGMPSGIVNVARLTGATLGVAVLGSIFATHAGGADVGPARFLTGMHAALLVAGLVAALAVGVAFAMLPAPKRRGARGKVFASAPR